MPERVEQEALGLAGVEVVFSQAEADGVFVGGFDGVGGEFDAIDVVGDIAEQEREEADATIGVHESFAAARGEDLPGVLEGEFDDIPVDLEEGADRGAQGFAENDFVDHEVDGRFGEAPDFTGTVTADGRVLVSFGDGG